MIPSVESMPIVARHTETEPNVVCVGAHEVGGRKLTIMAGPCSVESEEQVMETARRVKASGATFLRGGAFKPRTSPYSFQGLREEGLRLLAQAARAYDLGVITEVMDIQHLDKVMEVADILQVGSRNMQNFTLLDEVGRCGKPVMLKRGMAASLEEMMWSAERIAMGGNERVILCERGIRTFETSTRNTLDLNAVPMLRRASHLPVIVDPSHGTGHWWMVPHLSRAAVAVGADGLIIEVHVHPEVALSDGSQSLTPETFDRLMGEVRMVATAVGREV